MSETSSLLKIDRDAFDAMYEKPVLRQFGSLHLTTRGSAGTESDGMGTLRGSTAQN